MTARPETGHSKTAKMQSRRNTRSHDPAARAWLGRDGLRGLATMLLLAALFGAGIYFGGSPPATKQASASPWAPSDDDLSTGSILFVPPLGNSCRHRLIDNATWQIVDNGMVDCGFALAHRAQINIPKWSAARVGIVRDGFRQR
jgi:hypothetical protein